MEPAIAPVWNEGFSEEHKEALSGFESQEKLFEAIGYKVPEPAKVEPGDWRAGLDEEQLKTAERFVDPASMVRSIQESRKRESLVRVPGKEATDAEVATYHKAIGVPENPEGYVFELPEGMEMTPEMEESNKEWGQRLHDLDVPVETVNTLLGYLLDDAQILRESEVKADANFVAESESILKAEWKGEEYEKNKGVANRAFKEIANRAGIPIDELTMMQTSEGRFVMDDPRMMKIFAAFGREMAEGSLGPTMSEGERGTMQDQLVELRARMEDANHKGDSKTANRLYQDEQALIAKMDGNKPIH